MRVIVKEPAGAAFEPAKCPFQTQKLRCSHFARGPEKMPCNHPLLDEEPPKYCPLRRSPTMIMLTTDDTTDFPMVRAGQD